MLRYQRLDKDGFKLEVEGVPVHGTHGLFAARQLGSKWTLDHVPTGGKIGVFKSHQAAAEVARRALEIMGEEHLQGTDPAQFPRHARYDELKGLVERLEADGVVEVDDA